MANYNKKDPEQTERVWAYLTPEEKRKFRIRLFRMNLTTSSWIRSLILQFLDTPMSKLDEKVPLSEDTPPVEE